MNNKNLTSFAKRLKQCREVAGLTPGELATKLDVSRQMVGFLESGERGPTLSTLIKLSEILNVSVDTLVGKPPKS